VSRDVPAKKSIYSPRYDRFLRLLREARVAAGLSQTQAAKKLKRPQSFLSKCENGERRVDVVELIEFCRAYGISVGDFVKKI
jgi:transcriptional regulator with XRE-family HTH domain